MPRALLFGFALLAAGLLLFVPSISPRAAAIKSLVIIANAANADTKVKDNKVQLSDVKNWFLLNTTLWDDKTDIKVMPMLSSTDEAKFFLSKVLGMSEDELARHWTKKKEQDGLDQPKGRKDNAEVFRLVSRDTATGAVGYVDKTYYDGLSDEDRKKVKAVYTVSDS